MITNTKKIFTIIFQEKNVKVGVQRIGADLFEVSINNNSYEVIVRQENEKKLDQNINRELNNDLTNKRSVTSKIVNRDLLKILSPIPGKIVKTLFNEGEFVEKGAVIIQIEAMKMINDIICPWNGKIKQIVRSNTQVTYNEILVVIQPLE